METWDSWELTIFLLQTIGLDPEFPHRVIVCLFDEALHLDLCGTGYFQVLTGMKPEGFLGPLLLNDRGDFHWEDTHFAKCIPQRKHSECSPHCAVMDVCSNNSQDPTDVITGTQPVSFSQVSQGFSRKGIKARKTPRVIICAWMKCREKKPSQE